MCHRKQFSWCYNSEYSNGLIAVVIHIYVSVSFYTVAIDDRLDILDGVILAFSVSNGFTDKCNHSSPQYLHLITDECVRVKERIFFFFDACWRGIRWTWCMCIKDSSKISKKQKQAKCLPIKHMRICCSIRVSFLRTGCWPVMPSQSENL